MNYIPENMMIEYAAILQQAELIQENIDPLYAKIPWEINHTTDLICLLNPKFCFTYMNKACAKFIDCEQAKCIGKKLSDFTRSAQVYQLLKKQITQLLHGNYTICGTLILDESVPSEPQYIKYALALLIDNGIRTGILFVARNIKKDQLRICKTSRGINIKLGQQLIKLSNICPLPIFIADTSGHIILYNNEFRSCIEKMLNIEIKKIHLNDFAQARNIDYNQLASSKAFQGHEIRGQYAHFAGRDWLINSCPIHSDRGTINGAMVIMQDVSERENYQKDMRRINELNLVAEMAAGVAHEIRNPMTVIQGYLQVLLDKASPNSASKLKIILTELEHMNNILSNFLSIARNKPQEMTLQDLNQVINDIYPLLYSHCIANDINITMNLANDLPALLLNDKEIHQLLLNLSRNAIEAMTKDGILTIETRRQQNYVELNIVDTGCGMSEAESENIFKPFVTTKENGTGLGLSICSSIITGHNGTIKVKSIIGQGTKFIIELPIA